MKILSWNINGIRSSKRCLKDVLDALDADIICLQETKITRDTLDEPSAIVEGYSAYFSFSRKRTGYSGTANFCRDAATPVGAEEGLTGQLPSQSEGSIGCLGNIGEFTAEELRALDGEGRAIITQHRIELAERGVKDLAIINVYVPRAPEQDDRLTYKLRFLALLQSRAESLLRQGRHVIVLGDINTTHKRIDHCDPTTPEYLRTDSRQWIDQFLRPEDRDPELAPLKDKSSFEATLLDAEGSHFIDAFRLFYPQQEEAYTNWTTLTAARQTNYGKRLDYIFVDTGLEDFLEDCWIIADFEGSDHCPVVVKLRCQPVPSAKCPSLCTKFMPEFQGKQQKLLSFFSKQKAVESAGIERQQTVDVASGDQGSFSDQQQSDEGSGSQSLAKSSSPSGSPSLHSQKGEAKKKSSQIGQLKRAASDKVLHNPKKKKGKGDSSATSGLGGKQGSMLSFLVKPSKSPPSTTASSIVEHTNPASTTSRYWGQNAGGDGVPTGTSAPQCSNSMDSQSERTPTSSQLPEDPRPSSTKLSLPSLTLIPCRSELSGASRGGSLDAGSSLIEPKTSKSETSELEESTNGSQESKAECQETKAKASSVWKNLLSGPPPAPLCKGHREPCVLRTVKKPGPTKGKQFYVCARPEGHSSNKEARCDHFQWINYLSAGKKKNT